MSSALRPPSLGPIVGHATPNSVRIWIRGAESGESRTVGVAALFKEKKYVPDSSRYFRLRREYDRTGTIDFDGLQADTKYRVRVASLMVDSATVNAHIADEDIFTKLPLAKVWKEDLEQLAVEESEAEFRTFPDRQDTGLSFVFGSCRYPCIPLKASLSDRIFDAIYKRFQSVGEGASSPRFMLMVGDQIYADTLSRFIPVGLADTEAEFRDRYMSAFGSPNMRRLLRSVPHYMTLDDHEIEDNWVQGRIKDRDKRVLFNMAISAYMSYQWLHSPRNYDKRLYYEFECAGYPFFVTDGRTQRIRDDEDKILEDNHMFGTPAKGSTDSSYKGQVDILCDWLKAQQARVGDRPKFLVSGSVFAPNNVDSVVRTNALGCVKDNRWKDAAWAAFPETRRQILKTILDHHVQNVVFLSGDIHCSNVSEIGFHHKENGPLPLKAFAITSSAFYWPFPFADGNPLDYVHDSKLEGDGFEVSPDVTMHYKSKDFEQDDNFMEVKIDATTITAETINKKGESIRTSVLQLA